MRGPADLIGALSGETCSESGAGSTCGFAVGDIVGIVTAGVRGFLLRFIFGCGSVQTNSLTIVRLVLTPCRVSNSAMASHEAPLPRSSKMTSRQGWRF